MAEDIKTEYMSSLADLTFNSKPLINVLTMLAEENLSNAKTIVEAIEEQLAKVNTDVKLPILYLIDCIVKNVGDTYKGLFSHNIVATFCNVFKVVDEKTRLEMFKLRQTWNDVFPQMKLYAIDVQIRQIDPAWPVTAQPANSIHLNPKFLKSTTPTTTKSKISSNTADTEALAGKHLTADIDKETLLMQEQLLQKQKELLELQKKTLELEMLQTKVKLQEQMKSGAATPVHKNILLKPEVAKQLMPEVMTKSRPVGITQRFHGGQPKISPVNPALAAAVRPIRDPRLLRQQQKELESVAPVTQKPLENNKVITNKVHVNNPNYPRTQSKIDKKSKTVSPNNRSINKSSPQKSRSPPTVSNSSSSSSQDSPTKTKSRSSSGNSSSKNKKRDKPESKRSQDYDTKREKLLFDEEPNYPNSEPNFKSANKSKSRNYIRRNLADSPVQEISTKSAESRNPIEPTASLEPTSITKKAPTKPMDVDLRPVLSKKRTSTEASDQPTKKSKNLNELFGSQDTDMRPIPIAAEIVERPPTPPPPPIISSAPEQPALDAVSTKSDFDAVRAKLANAANREKIFNKSFRKDKLRLEDSPVRVSSEEELAIASGDMTPEQKQHILSRLFKHIEKSKLREAKKRDNQESLLGDLSLQTISDDEFEIEAPSQDTPPMPFNDKDERLNLPQILQPHNMETIPPGIDNSNSMPQQQFYPRGGRPPFRGRGEWRGNRGRMPLPRQPIRPWIHQQPGPRWRHFGPQHRPDFIPIEDESSKSPGQDDPQVQLQEDIKTLVIDGMPKDIRIYNETAVIFISNDDPREISFQNGSRSVCFNNKESYVLNFGENYKECLVNNFTFRVKLGVPSREIFINDIGFECFFGGPQIHITVNGINLSVSLEGPPPPVTIGETKRTDLVLAKIDALIDAQIILPIFLDSKLQKFVLGGRPCTLKFVDALKKVLINDVPHNVEFGALPKPFIIHGKKHFIRFSVLPKGFKPGFVKIKDMEGEAGVSPVREEEASQDGPLHGEPLRPETKKLQFIGPMSPDNRSNSPSDFLNNVLPGLNNFELSNVFSQSQKPVATTTGSYQVQLPGTSTTTDSSSSQNSAAPALNINDLFQKLVASGFVKTQEPTTTTTVPTSTVSNGKVVANKNPIPEPPKQQRRTLSEILKPVTFAQPKTLKMRQGALYSALYTGMQCSSCGMRFPPEASTWYSQHLDWHFRQNRKGKKNARVANSRKWYYSLADWKNYEELEDIEEREKNYFDQQQQQAEVAEEAEEEQEIPTVQADPATTDERCHVCRDTFEQFFNEEKEEWHLRNAIKIDDKTYHPVCYEDYNQTILNESKPKEESSLIPGLEIIVDDDDDEDKKSADEIVSLIDDDEEIELPEEAPSPAQDEDLPEEEDDGEDDDVILNEVAPIKIVVEDDDDEPMDAQNAEKSQPIPVKKEKKAVFDDGFVDVGEILTLKDHGLVKIKSEPIDDEKRSENSTTTQTPSESHEDSEVILTTEEPTVTSHPQLVTSMDGNMELVSTAVSAITSNAPKIKINISKPLPVIAPNEKNNSESSDNSDTVKSSSELPIEDLEIVRYKPGLQNVPLKKLPRVQKGSELTGMCSIM
ncbi:unnamed protein product [Ceutorhynchus assimilis]|uniref:Pre-mRNA cleavage complex 2 protein Pcf11 n=1 Tax=Ceutorhynchus assimilis TaxID=467358 RepID=A0A9N9MES1_9CUCU|nr:unnamed protein product [Ceutorhynchus assimilis]